MTTLQGCTLDWYMKFVQVPTGTPTKTLALVKNGLIEEFRKTKSKAQYITKLKEIKQYPNDTIWDFDHIFKTLMTRFIFEMTEIQHKEWFTAALLTHSRIPLMQ